MGETIEDKDLLLKRFNDTDFNHTNEKTLQEVFKEQSRINPDKVALIYKDEKLSYGELDKKSDELASFISARGIGAESIVALMVERSFEMIIAILGILKAGGAYLPVNPGHPDHRVKYLLENSGASLILTVKKFSNKFDSTEKLFFLDDDIYSTDGAKPAGSTCDNLAYIIYTSGSTGNPKGVMVEHRPVQNRINWMQRAYPIVEDDIILQKTPFDFDVSVWELFWWAFVGASLCLLEPDFHMSPEEMINTIEKNRVTVMHFVPSMLNLFLEYMESRPESVKRVESLKYVFSSGEALLPYSVNRFNKLLKGNRAKLINLYGPTEATVDVSYFNCFKEDNSTEEFNLIPIGKPIDNIKLYILDEKLNPLSIGEEGELYIGGAGLARGYINNPELTSKVFIDSPFISGERIYKTGDRARWMDNGNIEYLGRVDFQVKVRGFRIEPGEIESLLLKDNEIKQAVVIAKDFYGRGVQLAAYLVCQTRPAVDSIKDYLLKFLPEYMVPSYWVFLDEIPLNSNGKVDRKALPEPESGGKAGNESKMPENELQKKIKAIWSEVLKRDDMGITDNFFDLGGHSILLAQVHSSLSSLVEKKFTIIDLLTYPTIESLAEFLLSTSGKSDENKSSGAVKSRAARQRKALERQKLLSKKKKKV